MADSAISVVPKEPSYKLLLGGQPALFAAHSGKTLCL
jgi:hypothetical protein